LFGSAPAVRPSSAPTSELRARLREVEAVLARQERELHDLRESEERYRAVARNLPNAAVALFDRDLRFVLVEGQGLMENIGVEAPLVVGRTLWEVATPANVGLMEHHYRRTLEGHAASFEVERNGRTVSIHATPIRDEHDTIILGMMTTYDVTSFRAAEAALRQQTQLVGLLQAVTFAANAAETSAEAMQVCLEEVCAYTGWPIGHAYIRQDDVLVPSSIWSFGDTLWTTEGSAADVGAFVAQTGLTVIERGSGFVGAVLESGRSLSMDSLEGFLRAESASAAGIKSGFALPVLVGSEVAAVLEFYAMTDEAPDANTLEVLSNVGTQIGRVIERERARAVLEAHASAVRSMSARDELTGLYNRRGFMELAGQRLDGALRTGVPAVLFFADLNGMKPINDELGHEEGDRALVDMANVWRKVFRGSDIIARLGGDEFVIFASGVDPRAAHDIRARIVREVDAFNALGSRLYRLSVALGAALFDPAEPRSLEELVSAADAAMYAHKRQRSGV
jgi:diguanylate cyclase (GGDEF)-like protein/PAS domain S-box-containing protein